MRYIIGVINKLNSNESSTDLLVFGNIDCTHGNIPIIIYSIKAIEITIKNMDNNVVSNLIVFNFFIESKFNTAIIGMY